MSIAMRVAVLLLLFTSNPTWGQKGAGRPATNPPRTRWTVLFRADDPSLWGQNAKGAKGEQLAIPLRFAPATFNYLRLRRMDTDEALILPLAWDELENGKLSPDAEFWWNGTAKEEWKGRHLGIVQAPRHKFPAPRGMIAVMNDGWDGFAGSGFGHKCFANDGQYYCWRGKEIPRTIFEIAVSDGPLSPAEERCLLFSGKR